MFLRHPLGFFPMVIGELRLDYLEPLIFISLESEAAKDIFGIVTKGRTERCDGIGIN